MRLEDLNYSSGDLEYSSVRLTEPVSVLGSYIERARGIVAELEADPRTARRMTALTEELEGLRWFPLP